MREQLFQPSRDDKPRMVPCRFCPANVDREPVAAARHLLMVCPRASEEALEVARRVLKGVSL